MRARRSAKLDFIDFPCHLLGSLSKQPQMGAKLSSFCEAWTIEFASLDYLNENWFRVIKKHFQFNSHSLF